MTFFKKLYRDHDREELIRTVDSVISIVIQFASLSIQAYGLWYITHHTH